MVSIRYILLLACSVVILGGCAGEEYTYVSERELKPGPGVFSGKDGGFTLYRGKERSENEQDNDQLKDTVEQ